MYRFRSLKNLLDRNELENQKIYFCPYDELNDPLEGHSNFFWQGDEIVWANLLKHYILCLNHMFTASNFRTYEELYDYKIPTEEIFNFLEAESLDKHIINLFESLLSENLIKNFLYYLTNKKISVYSDELLAGLRIINHLVCFTILSKSKEYGYFINIHIKTIEDMIQLMEENTNIKHTANYLKDLAELHFNKTEEKFAKISKFNSIYENISLEYQKICLTEQKNMPYCNKNILSFNYVFFDFPNIYMENIKHLICDKTAIASFTTSYTNTVSWSIYANNHTGVCLKFKTKLTKNNHKTISLLSPDKKYCMDSTFLKVNYNGKIEKIDFFKFINILPEHIQNFWYKNERGIKSSCYILDNQEEIKNSYWKKLFQISTTKKSYWIKEDEYRLIHHDPISKDARLWTYDLTDLEEIIFGIKTPLEAKIKIIEIIERKLQENPSANIKISQAIYDNKKNEITSYTIDRNQLKELNLSSL